MEDATVQSSLPLKPLKITCTSSDCNSNLHCFRATRKMKKLNRQGHCRSCGVQLVDWNRVFRRDLTDATYTFAALKLELIRHHFWHSEFDERALFHARRKGRLALADAAERRIRKSVASESPVRDGRQTPFEGNVLYYAQHATASCCRKCIEGWHGIPQGRALSEEEVHYLTQLVLFFVDDRLPSLSAYGEKVPRRRNGREQSASAISGDSYAY